MSGFNYVPGLAAAINRSPNFICLIIILRMCKRKSIKATLIQFLRIVGGLM